jgi:hypothetical protein
LKPEKGVASLFSDFLLQGPEVINAFESAGIKLRNGRVARDDVTASQFILYGFEFPNEILVVNEKGQGFDHLSFDQGFLYKDAVAILRRNRAVGNRPSRDDDEPMRHLLKGDSLSSCQCGSRWLTCKVSARVRSNRFDFRRSVKEAGFTISAATIRGFVERGGPGKIMTSLPHAAWYSSSFCSDVGEKMSTHR